MVTELAPSLLAFFPLFLLAATVFFDGESKRIAASGRPGLMVASGVLYLIVVLFLSGSSILTLFALFETTVSEFWGTYLLAAIMMGAIGAAIFLLLHVYVVLGRLVRSASKAADARRVAAGLDIRDAVWLQDKSLDGLQGALTGITVGAAILLAFLVSKVLPMSP